MKIFKYLVFFVFTFFIIVKVTGYNYLLKGVWATYMHGTKSATIDDEVFFDTREIEVGENKYEWSISKDYNKKPLSKKLQNVLTQTQSIAFLVTKNDSILQEYYWDGFSDSSRSNSFSAIKSVVTMLTQIAIQKGFIKSWNQKVTDFFPELKGPFAKDLEIGHLSNMSAGLEWKEDYKDPFNITADAYYGNDVWDLMLNKVPVTQKPGQTYVYQSGSTQLLGMVLIKATGKHLSTLAQEWLWQPLGAQHNATWHLDNGGGTELAYCCFNSNARDFALFGKLMRHYGNLNGVQILDSNFVQMATQPALAQHYGYSFWLDQIEGYQVYYQHGFHGQYIITVPKLNLNIVRLGYKNQKLEGNHPADLIVIVTEVIQAQWAQ